MPPESEVWLQLGLSGISPGNIKILFENLGRPEKIIELVKNAPLSGSGAKPAKINWPALKTAAEKIIETGRKNNFRIIAFSDPEYPEKLKHISDPPPVLFVRGRLEKEPDHPVLGVVGTRRATGYGQSFLEKILPPLVASGFIISSGLALGIDTLAHRLTLENQGVTWAFLGTGVDVCYPARNRNLYQAIGERGALVSEFLPGTGPETWNFPRRNRLISGVADGVLVVEADYKSGALITAKCALDQDREVLALPGSIFSPNSAGCHWLIKQGAALVETAEDIAAIFRQPLLIKEKKAPPGNFTEFQKKILQRLEAETLSLDQLAEQTAAPVSQLAAEIMGLVISGAVKEQPGQRFLLI